jgi:hypothetical protein
LGAMSEGAADLKPEGDFALDLFLKAASCTAAAPSSSQPQFTGER